MKKMLFRFFFSYFLLTTAPWLWFDQIPGVSYLTEYYNNMNEWVVKNFNKYLFHIKDTLNVDGGGSGDTSFGWAQFYAYILLSMISCIVWTLLDKKRQNYNLLDFWLGNIIRYYIAIISFTYGIIKLFTLQMPFPNLSQLATPLGDFLPMRLSWMFIGYSTTYQIFSGAMETIVGILLLNRKTVTLGALLGIGVYTNVFLLNISYDVPVKLFSMQLVIGCIFLAVRDWRRLLNFFLLNKPVVPTIIYDIDFPKSWQKALRIVWKVGFIILFIILPFNESWSWYKAESDKGESKPILSGIYTIKTFIKNYDKVSISANDEMIWKDFIFDRGGIGSVHTLDTLFRQRYRRGYFTYQPDTLKETIAFKNYAMDSASLFEMRYKIIDEKTLGLWGRIRSDSLYFELLRSDRQFQLAERQFHWISESNR